MNNHYWIYILLLICGLLLSLSTQGQNRTITGKIFYKENQKPISGAKVFIQDYETYIAITNQDGLFSIKVPSQQSQADNIVFNIIAANGKGAQAPMKNLDPLPFIKLPIPRAILADDPDNPSLTKNNTSPYYNQNTDNEATVFSEKEKEKQNTSIPTSAISRENIENSQLEVDSTRIEGLALEKNQEVDTNATLDESSSSLTQLSPFEEYKKDFLSLEERVDIEKRLLVEGNQDIREGIVKLLSRLKSSDDLTEQERDSLTLYVFSLEDKIDEYSEAYEGSQTQLLATLEQVKAILNAQEDRIRINRITIFSLLGIIVGLSLLSYIFYIVNKRTQKQKAILAENIAQINKQKAQIEEQNQEITDSVHYAERIQQALLVNMTNLDEFFRESFIFHLPRDIVSGDFYWYTQQKDEIVLAVVDCTGHGVPGAFMTIIANDALNQIVNDNKITEPKRILEELDTKVQVSLNQQNGRKEGSTNDSMDLMIANFNFKTKKVVVAGARNVLYFVKEDEIHQVKGSKYMIGNQHRDEEKTFDPHLIDLEGGEVFYMFSDGFQDQFGGEDDSKYLKTRFRGFLHSISHLTLAEQYQEIEKEFNQWKGDNPQTDDVLVVGVKI